MIKFLKSESLVVGRSRLIPFWLLIVFLAALIFWVDLQLPLGVAGGVLYVAVVLLGWWLPNRRNVILVAVLASLLTTVGYVYSPPGGIAWMVLSNRGIALFAIWCIAALIVQRKPVEAKLLEERKSEQENLVEQEQILHTLLDNMPGAMWLVDQDLNLVFANDQYVDFYGDENGLVKPGTPISEILRQEARQELLGGDGNVDEIVERRLESYRGTVETTFEDNTVDGRKIRLIRRPTSSGFVVSVATDISEIIEAQRSSKLLSEALNTFADMVILYDKDERVIFSNNQYHEIYPNSPSQNDIKNYTMESLLRRSLDAGQISHPLAQTDPDAWIKNALDGRRDPKGGAGETLHSSGRTFFYRYERTTEGGMILLQTDISDRKKMEEALKESELRLATTLDDSPIGVSIVDAEGKSRFVNRRIAEMIGVPQSSLVGVKVQTRYVRPQDREDLLQELRDKKLVVDKEVELIRSNGTPFWVLMTMMSTEYDGEPAVMAWMYDITARKAADEVLKERERQFVHILENSPIAVGISIDDSTDDNGLIVYANINFANMVGFTLEAVGQIRTSEFFDDQPERERHQTELDQGNSLLNMEQKIIDGDGVERWVLMSIIPIDYHDRRSALIWLYDITEQKETEEHFRLDSEIFTAMFDANPTPMLVRPVDQLKYLRVNQAAGTLFGLSQQDLLEINPAEIWYEPEEREKFVNALEQGEPTTEVRVKHFASDGYRDVVATTSTISYDGAPALLMTGTDITERKMMEQSLRESEQKLLNIFENSPIGIGISIDDDSAEDGVIQFANSRMMELIGFGKDQVGEIRTNQFILNEGDREHQKRQLEYSETILNLEQKMRCIDGTTIWVLMSLSPMQFEDRQSALIWIFDISDRKAAEENLIASATLLRGVLNNINQGLITFDDKRELQAWNGRTKEILGFPDGFLQPGVSALDIAVHIAGQGAYGSENIDERVESFWSGDPVTRATFRLANGLSYDAIATRTPENWVVITYTDTTERDKSERQIRKILEQLPGGITVAGLESSDLAFANSDFRDLFGIAEEDIPKTKVGSLYVNQEDRAYVRNEITEGNAVRNREIRLKRADGQEFWGQVNVLPFEYEGMPASLGGYYDITAQKNAEADIINARDAAETATKAKAAFLAAMSHEIRTPMNGVVGMVDLLQQTSLTDDQKQMLNTVRDSGQSLLTIINDILDFSKIEAGKLELEEIPIALIDVVEGSVQTIAPNAVNKGLRLVSYVDPDIPPLVLGDSVRLRQILINLGGNAIKFSETGEVFVRAELLQCDDKRARVRFGVIDKGIGISEDAQKTLFQEFSQADTSTTRKFGGTGLGLSISQRLTELMGGEIGVNSILGEGSEFFADILFSLSDKSLPPETGDDLDGLNIVVINPIGVECSVWQRYLEHWKAEVSSLPSLDEFAETLTAAGRKELPYDVAVLAGDHDVDKVIATRQTAIDCDRLPYPRFVISRDPRSRIDALEGLPEVTLVDSNPVRRAALLSAVAIAAGRASPEVSYEEEVEEIRLGRAPTIEEARAQGKLILLAEDNLTNQDVIRRQLTLLGYACEIASDGREGRDMWQANDYALLLTDCHMPEMDGFELTAAVRETEESTDRRAPIIAITANALQGEAERCLAAGMDDYLSKPVDMKGLKSTLQKWMGNGGVAGDAHAALPTGKAPLSPPDAAPENGPIDPSALKSVFGDDEATFIEILKDFVEPATSNVDEIDAALTEHSADGVAKAAHKLKSSARSVGANDLADLCQVLEAAGNAEDWSEIDKAALRLSDTFQKVVDYIVCL
jgi:PAS domain S-box-containing protein